MGSVPSFSSSWADRGGGRALSTRALRSTVRTLYVNLVKEKRTGFESAYLGRVEVRGYLGLRVSGLGWGREISGWSGGGASPPDTKNIWF